MSSWPIKPLGKLCEVLDRYRKPITKSDRREGPYPYFGAMGVVDYVDGFLFDEPLILLGEDGAKWGSGELCAFKASGKYWVNNHAHIMRPDRSQVLDDWLVYYLCGTDLLPFITGLTVPKLNQERMREIPIPLPPLEEQRRIVAVLDEAFAAIATATTNAQKNLANARELLTAEVSALFGNRGDGWLTLPLGSVCEMYQPTTIGKKDMVDDGPYIVFGANGAIGRYDKFNHEEPQLLVTCRGATCGSVNMSEPFAWITGNAMVVRPKDKSLRLGLLRSIFQYAFDFSKVITGAAQPQITRQSFAPAIIAYPAELSDQITLESRIDSIAAAMDELIACYEQKLETLAKLKQSLLHRAFTGELTTTAPDLVPA